MNFLLHHLLILLVHHLLLPLHLHYLMHLHQSYHQHHHLLYLHHHQMHYHLHHLIFYHHRPHLHYHLHHPLHYLLHHLHHYQMRFRQLMGLLEQMLQWLLGMLIDHADRLRPLATYKTIIVPFYNLILPLFHLLILLLTHFPLFFPMPKSNHITKPFFFPILLKLNPKIFMRPCHLIGGRKL